MDLLGGEAAPLHADHVEARQPAAIADSQPVRNEVFADAGETAKKGVGPDAHELMHRRPAAEDGVVADPAMAGQHDVVRQQHALAEPAIVRDMAVGEEHAPVSDDGLAAAARRAGVHGDALADYAIGADAQRRRLAMILQVLRLVANRGEREHPGAGAEHGVAGDRDVGYQLDGVAKHDPGADVTERPDLDALAQPRAGFDHGAAMDGRQTGTSIADTSAWQTRTSSTFASPRNHQMLRRLLIFVMCSLS